MHIDQVYVSSCVCVMLPLKWIKYKKKQPKENVCEILKVRVEINALVYAYSHFHIAADR